MPDLSIIIPMYNVEPYIQRCLQSIINQDISRSNFEIICINDGSPDNAREVVLKFMKEFENISLIDQENQGVSRARNNGIEKAKGRYLLFIDPDDFIEENSLGRVLKKADQMKCQVSFLGFTFLRKDQSIRTKILHEGFSTEVFNGIEAYYLSRSDGKTDPDRMWAVLFEREFINKYNLRYLPDVPYLEDGELIARILCLADRCIFDGRNFYQRTTRPGSATNSKLSRSEKAIDGFYLSAGNLKKFKTEFSLTHEQSEFLNQPICKFVFLVLIHGVEMPRFRNFRQVKIRLIQEGLKSIEKKGVVLPYLKFVPVYNFSPLLCIFFLYIRSKLQKLNQ